MTQANSENYPGIILTDLEYLDSFAQGIYSSCRALAGVGSDPRGMRVIGSGGDAPPYQTRLLTKDSISPQLVFTTTDLRLGTKAFIIAGYWLSRKQGALIAGGTTQEKAENITSL